MTHLLTLAANVAAFLVALRIVPGFDFAYGRAYWKLGLVLAAVSLVATYGPAIIARFVPADRSTLSGRSLLAGAQVAVMSVFVGVLGLLSGWLNLGLNLGGFPGGFSLASLGVLVAVGIIASVVPVGLLLVRTTDGPLPLPFRAIAASRPSRSDAVLLMFFASGAAGLAYEVVWARQLVLVFGNTTQATSAILTGYFGGLALGSVIGGAVADRVRSPLRLYGIIEIALVGIVLLTPVLFQGINELYRSSYPTFGQTPTALALFRFGLAILALAPATVLMGATLPTLSRHLTRRARDLSGNFARLYAMNTVGAVVGTAVAGFVLIEIFGLTATLLVGALASGSAGVAALVLSARIRESLDREHDDPVTEEAPETASTGAPGVGPARALALTVAFVSGLTSLGYQVLWTRLLASGSGNSTYVFTLILSIFLIGIAIGAAVYARRLSESSRLVGFLGLAQLTIAAIALAGLPIIALLVELPLLVRTLLVVLPATLVLGLTLPMSSRLLGGTAQHVGRDAGFLLGANTLGAICGTFVVPFVLIPTLGSPQSVAALALVNAALGAFLVARVRGHALPAPRPVLVAGGLALIVAASGSIAVPTRFVGDPGLALFANPPSELFASAEDEIASVHAGVERDGLRHLVVGGTGMTALTVDARFMTYLPLMLRPDAEDLLVIAFGMGSSWRSGLIADLRADAVELVPSVPGMLRYFHADADALLANPAGRIIVADGRNYVELTDRRYDIVIVDPPPPIHSSGTAILYSREFYEASASVLNDQGVMMEWMPYGQTVDEFRAHVRTFASVFPNVALIFGPAGKGVYMLGSTGPVSFDAGTMRGVLERPGVLADLESSVDAPVSMADEWLALLQEKFWLDDAGARAFGGEGPLITDDHPLPEYFLLRRLFGEPSPRMTEPNLRAAAPTTLR